MKRIIVALKLNFGPATDNNSPFWGPAVLVSAQTALERLIAALGPEYEQGSGQVIWDMSEENGQAIVRLSVTDRGLQIVRNYWDVASVQIDELLSMALPIVSPTVPTTGTPTATPTATQPAYVTVPAITTTPISPAVGVSLPGTIAPMIAAAPTGTAQAATPDWVIWAGGLALIALVMKGK